MPSPLRLDALPAATRRLFELISEAGGPELEAFTLVGGTAIALHLGHRMSVDLGCAPDARALPREAIRMIMARLQQRGVAVSKHQGPAEVTARDEFINAGMDLDDFQQNFVADGVKVTFFSPDDETSIQRSHQQGRLHVAGPSALSEMKALLLQHRATARDLVDIYCLMQAGHFSRDLALAAYETCGATQNWSMAFSESRLNHAGSAPDDPGYEAIVDLPPLAMMAEAIAREIHHAPEVGATPT